MTKFKVGDEFMRTVSDGTKIPAFTEGYRGRVAEVDSYCVKDENGFGHSANCIELVTQTSPVRTVTRKEIVEGQYGMVLVDVHRDQVVVVVKPWHQPSPAELRAAAEVFTQLADALEDQK